MLLASLVRGAMFVVLEPMAGVLARSCAMLVKCFKGWSVVSRRGCFRATSSEAGRASSCSRGCSGVGVLSAVSPYNI